MEGLQNYVVIRGWGGRDMAGPTREFDSSLPRSAPQDCSLATDRKGDCAHRLTVATEVVCALLHSTLAVHVGGIQSAPTCPTARGRCAQALVVFLKENAFPTDEAGISWEFLGGRCTTMRG